MKTNSPLIVDSNAPLTPAVSLQRFQAISRRNAQVYDLLGGVHVI
jgi:hypothetical protein